MSISTEQYREQQAAGMSERALQDRVLGLARAAGYSLAYHTHDSRRSQPGFPDLVLINPTDQRLIFAELKTMRGRVTHHQKAWLDGIEAVEERIHDLDNQPHRGCAVSVYVWRPIDLFDGTIEEHLGLA
jgi:hypothetical protein